MSECELATLWHFLLESTDWQPLLSAYQIRATVPANPFDTMVVEIG